MFMAQIEASKNRQSNQDIDCRLGEGPPVRDCGVKAPSESECFAREMRTSRVTGVSVIESEFHRGLIL
jgi:hypothetical protein